MDLGGLCMMGVGYHKCEYYIHSPIREGRA